MICRIFLKTNRFDLLPQPGHHAGQVGAGRRVDQLEVDDQQEGHHHRRCAGARRGSERARSGPPNHQAG